MEKCISNRFVFSLFFSIILLINSHSESSQNTAIQFVEPLESEEYTTESQFVRAHFTNKEMAHNALDIFEVEAFEISYEDNYIVLNVALEDIKTLTDLNFKVTPYPDYDMHHNRITGVQQTGTIQGYPSYRIVEKTFEIAESLCTEFPDFATWIDAGDSWEKVEGIGGYDIMVLRLTNSKIAGPKPKYFITGSIHAREYSTSELNLRFVLYLLENYGKDADATWMLDYQEFHAMFYANPDGRKHAEEGKYWRKNTNSNYCKSNPSKRGCDLNRNFDASWSGSSDECGETFSGASAASEPETQAVQNWLKQEFTEEGVGVYMDLHSYGEIIINSSTSEIEFLAKKFSHFNGYGTKANTRGMTITYAYNVVGVASYLFELGTSFFQNCNEFENTLVPDNIKAFEYAFRVCREPRKLPAGPEVVDVSYTSNVLTATVDDGLYAGSSASQTIAAAEYYIGTPPWVTGATAIPMEAVDGSFNAKEEEVTATISSRDLRNRQVLIYVRGKDADDNWGPVSATFSDLTPVTSPIPEQHISQVEVHYPNPLLLPATITVKLPQAAHTQLLLYNVSGKVLATLTDNVMGPGAHAIRWDGKSDAGKTLAEGIYLFRLQVNEYVHMGKMALVK